MIGVPLLIPTDEREISPSHKFYSHFDKGGEDDEEDEVSRDDAHSLTVISTSFGVASIGD